MADNRDSFAVFGNPVGHSLSPVMHRAAFAALGLDARYIARQCATAGEAVTEIRDNGLRGASITIPFKVSIMELLDEVGEDVRDIGAVNTIINESGRLLGRNTDWCGFLEDLKDAAIKIKGERFAVVGAGGAARAVVYGLLREGGTPAVFSRDPGRGEALAGRFGCENYPLAEFERRAEGILVNTTPVGMHPQVNESLINGPVLERFAWVIDLVYNPPRTKLLEDAERFGCRALSGLGMLVNQGAEQIRIWTGKEPPRALMRIAVEDELRRMAGKEK